MNSEKINLLKEITRTRLMIALLEHNKTESDYLSAILNVLETYKEVNY